MLVRAMGRITGLERDDFFPSALAERSARLARLEPVFHEGAAGDVVDQNHAAGEAIRRHRGDVLRAWMRVFGSAENRLGFALAIDFVDLGELQDREPLAVIGGQRDIGADLERMRGRLVDRERDRNRPRRARRKAHLVAAARVVGFAHESGQRRERARGEHLEVRDIARGQSHIGQRRDVCAQRGALGRRRFQIDQLAAAVRGDRVVAHAHREPPADALRAALSAALWRGIKFLSSRVASSFFRLCSTFSALLSISNSGVTGSSYGSETPVNDS